MIYNFILSFLFFRSDHKDIIEDVSESQQSGYSQCKSKMILIITIIISVIHLDLNYFTILYKMMADLILCSYSPIK